jgi:outer membrane protein
MEGLFMTGALKLWAASLAAAFTVTCAQAAEPIPAPLPPPEPPAPTFYARVGALGIITQDNASNANGGFFHTVNPLGFQGPATLATIDNIATRPLYTLGYDLGYFLTPEWSLSFFSGVPPILHVKATGIAVFPNVPGANHNLIGTSLLGSMRWGPGAVTVDYHFTQFGAIQPYVGAGAAYILHTAHISDGILRNFFVDQDWCLALKAGVDVMLTPNWGMFAQVVKLFYEPDAGGFLLNTNIPIRVHVVTDPWFPMAGITFKY